VAAGRDKYFLTRAAPECHLAPAAKLIAEKTGDGYVERQPGAGAAAG
jgi:hypothetical protein